MKIGIIGPCEDEIMPFIGRLDSVSTENRAKLNFNIGKFYKTDIVALSCGIGKVNASIAAQILIDKYDVTHIILTGVAGGINENLKIFDTVISSEIAYHDAADWILTQYHPYMESNCFKADPELVSGILRANSDDNSVITGKIVTGEVFIEQDGREEIIKKYNPQCVDMETASIAHVCYVNSIPFAAIRSLSDTVHESGIDSFKKYVKKAAEKSIDVLIKYLDLIQPVLE